MNFHHFFGNIIVELPHFRLNQNRSATLTLGTKMKIYDCVRCTHS